MTDVHSKEVRSFNMGRIKGKDTKPEMLVRSFLFNKGFRYRLHDKKLPGKPDMVFPKYRTVVFINGCFWHGHKGCKYFKLPQTRTRWWADKIKKNQDRDVVNITALRNSDWRVITIWECLVKNDKKEKTLEKLVKDLSKWQRA